MALNIDKLRAKAAKKPEGKPTGKEVAAQYYARQEAAKGINTAQADNSTGNSAVGAGNTVGTGAASVPASAPVDEVSSARAYLDDLAARLNAETPNNNNMIQSPARISGDLRGVAMEGKSGAFSKDLPSGAPAVRPAMQKSVEDYKAANEAAEVLAQSGKLSDKDIGTLSKAYNTAVSDASAYDAAVARQAPTDFANKVDKLQSKPVSGIRHDAYTAARPMEAIGGADGAKMSYDEIRAANEDFNKRYAAVYKDYTSGKATAADMASLGKDKAKLDRDNNAFLASAQDSFARAVNKAYVKYVPRADRMEVKLSQGVPSGYNGAKADAAEADVQRQYADVYAKFLRGEASEKELAELKGKALAVEAQNAAYWDTTEGIIEYGKRLQANRATIKKELDAAEKWNAEHEGDYLTSIGNEIETANQAKADNPDGWSSDKNVRIAQAGVDTQEATRARAEALRAAYNAANYSVNLNDLQYTYAQKYKSAYIAAKKDGYQDPANVQQAVSEILRTSNNEATSTLNRLVDFSTYGTREQKQIYLYLYNAKGKAEANEFVKTIRPMIDVVKAMDVAKRYADSGLVGKMAIGAITQASGGLSDFSAGLTGVGKALIGDTSYTFPTTAQSVASGVREAEGGAVAGAAMDIIRSTANMAPSIAVGYALSAAGMPGAALIRSLSFGGSAGGNAYIQSINDGKGYGKAVLYGAVVGTSEVCLERVLGGIEGLGGKGVSRFMETKAGKAVQARLSSFLSKFGTTTKGRTALEVFNATGRFLSNNTAEGLEEFTQDMLDPIFRNVIFGEDNAVFTQKNFDNAMYSFCIGFWNAGLLNGLGEISRFKKVNRIINGKGTMQDVTDALESPEMRRDLERIFTHTFEMADGGNFTFSDNELVNAVFLQMWQNGVKQGTAHADDIRAEAGDAADVAQSGVELAEAVNKAADSVADKVGEDIAKVANSEDVNAAVNQAKGIIQRQNDKTFSGIKDYYKQNDTKGRVPFAESRSDLAGKLSALEGQEITVGGKDYTLQKADKRAIKLTDSGGKTHEIVFAGSDITYYDKSFNVKDRNGKNWYFGFSGEQLSKLGIAEAAITSAKAAASSAKAAQDVTFNPTEQERFDMIRANAKENARSNDSTSGLFANSDADLKNKLNILQGENVSVNGRSFVLKGIDGNVIRLVDEGGNERAVDLSDSELKFRHDGFEVVKADGKKRLFVFDDSLVDAVLDLYGNNVAENMVAKNTTAEVTSGRGVGVEQDTENTQDAENAKDASEDLESRKKAPVVRKIHFDDDTENVSSGESTVKSDSVKEAAKEPRSSKAEPAGKELAETSSIEPEKPVKDYPYNQTAADKPKAAVQTDASAAPVAESTSDVGAVVQKGTASDTSNSSKIEQIKQKAISPKEALDNSSPFADESYSEIDKKSSRAAEALSGALGVNIKIFSDTAGIGNFYDSASDTLYINGDGEFPVSYQLRRGLMTMLASSDSSGFAKLRDFLVGKYKDTFGKDAYTEYAEKKKKVFAENGLSLDEKGVGDELCADLFMHMFSGTDTARAIAKEIRTPEAKKLLRALEMLSKTDEANFDFLPTTVEALGEADMKTAEKMALDMFFRDGVGKDRKNSYVVAEKTESKASDAVQETKPQEKKDTSKADSAVVKEERESTAAVKTDAAPEVSGKTDVQAKPEVESKAKTASEPKAKPEVKTEIQAEAKPEEIPKVDAEGMVQAKPEAKSDYVFADLPAHMVVKSKNTKAGETIYVLKLKKYVSPDDYKAINAQVKAKGGYYSRDAQGFIVPKEIFDAYNAEALSKLYKADFYLLKDLDGEDNFTKESGYGIELSAKDGTPMTFYLFEENGQWIPVEASTGMLCGYERPTLPEAIQQLTPEFLQEIKSDYLTKDEQKQAAEKLAKLKEAVDNKRDVGYNEAGNVKDVKNGKEGTEDVQGRGILDGESRHDGGRLRRGITGSDDGSGNSEDVSEARKDSGRVLQGDSIDQASGRDGGNVSKGTHGSDDRGSDHGEVKESSSRRGRTGDIGGRDSGHDGLASEQLLTEESGADTGAASDVSSAGKKAAKTIEDEKKAVKKGQAEKAQEKAPEEVDTEATAITEKRPSNKENFSISDEVAAKLDSTAPNAMDNIAAIKLLKRIEEEGRPATVEEKEILAKYKGWGGIDLRNLNYEARRDLGSLFSYEQRVAMQNSSLTAYFTPTKVIDAMYTGLMRMGFKGGNILESSMGIGNFFGRMPAAISAKSSLTGVEMESYTARIAQLLYPGATVINKPFQDVAMRNDAFDLVIGNVPFGTTYLSYGKKKYLLHNYFILSSLDKVREGGIVAVLTSAGTLDSYGMDARKAIMDKADVVACYKLPERVFSQNANTDVQTDLLILRKRAAGAKPTGDSILNVVTTEDGLRINEYFAKHPENVLGTLAKGTNAWGEITTVKGVADFYERLTAAMNKLPSGLFTGKTTLAPVESIISVSTKPRFFEKNGAVYEDSGEGKATKVAEKKQGTVRDYMAVRDAYKEMLDAYGKNLPETDIKPLRDKLTSVYDNFTAKHGPITGDGKKKIGGKKSANNTFLEADSDYYLVGGLEKYDEKAKKFEKSALFEKDTLRKKEIEHVDTASDALVVSLNESGKVDFKRMHALTGMSEQKLIDELSGEIVLTPEGDYVLTDIYLSGNIYEKLDAVNGKKGFEKQQEMLEKAIPTPKAASEIDVKLGANYIDVQYIQDFAKDVLQIELTISKDSAGHWSIEGVRASRYGDILTKKYGIREMNAVQILEKILNDGEINVMMPVSVDGGWRNVLDEEKTNIAKQKADDIREAFADWVFKSSERRNDIVDKYNRMYNNYKPLDYGKIAEKLSFDSMDADLKRKLYPHQKRAIARALFGGDVLFAHGVGTGKTFEMIASVMEAKRMGLVNKAAMVVPKNKVSDFKKDIARAYPNAKVLIVSTQNVKRQSMIGLIGSNDWDIVLLSRETFTKIPVSETLQQNFVLQQLEDVQRELFEAQADRNTARRVINGLKKRSETLENKLKEIDKATKRDENAVDFEKLGVDCICVDEAHNYKSIVTPTRLNIKGLSKTGDSQRANDMLMKLDYMRTIGGKIIFGTGTPITNTVSEIYNMARMVCPSVLEEAGIHSLDEWVNTFCKVESTTEIDIGNNIKSKSTQIIRKFINPNEMIGMFRQFADVVFTEDVVTNLPKAKFIQVEIEGTDVHKKVMKTVGSALQNAKNSEKMKVSSQVMAMATVAAADPKMLAGAASVYNPFVDYSAEELEFENSKMNKMCDITFDEYKKSNDIKGTQIIFCDSGAGSGTIYSFNLHKDIKEKLIKRGIPENEIVIVQSQSDEKLEELFRQVNDGEVRVLIGTSAKMAEGLNVQKRVVAIHHPTVTFTPADLEQGNARGVRQGNMNSEVRIYNYVQGDTFDAYKWQAQARKGEMIKRALRGEAVSELEDVGGDIDPTDAMAVASGNPLVKDKIDIDKEVVRLKTLQRNHLNEVYAYQDTIAKNPGLIVQTKLYIANMARDIGLRDKFTGKEYIAIGDTIYTKQTEANKALAEAIRKAPKDGEYRKLGVYNGFDIMFKGETGGLNYSILLKGANGYPVAYTGAGNTIARFSGVLRRLESVLESEKESFEKLTSDLELAKEEVKKPFEHQGELDNALQKQKDITYQYEHYGEKKAETTKKKTETESGGDIKAYRADRRQQRGWKTKRAASFKKSKAKVKPIPEIVDKIREKFDVPVRTGNMRSRGTLGQYDERQISIRSRFANDLPTLSHELGHYLDAEYGFSDKQEIRELIHALPEPFKAMYSESVLPGEAFAEYLRKYLTNKDAATKKFQEFTELFERTLSDGDMQSVNELADDINAYLSSTPEERLQASVLSKEQIAKRDKISKSEAFDNMRRRAKDYFVDDISALEELGELVGIDSVKNGRKSPYALAFLARKAEYTGYHIITNELCDMEGNPVGKSLMERLYPVGNNMDNFNYYLVAKRAVEVLKRNPDLPLMPDPTLNDVGELQRIVDKYDRRYPEFEKVSEDVYDFLRQVQRLYGQASGVESAEQLNFLEDIYPHYVPLKRALKRSSERLTGGAKSGYANQNSSIKRFKGSTEEFVAPTDSIIDMVMRVVKVARRNAVGVAIADIANKSEGLANIIERVEPSKKMQSFDLMKQKEELVDKALEGGMVDKEGKFKDLLDSIFDDVMMTFIPYADEKKDMVSFRVNGKTQYFQIGNKRLYNAIINMNGYQDEPLIKVLNKIQGIMKYGIVGVNPAYIIGNFAKDIGTAWYSNDEMNFASFAASYVATAKDILLNDPEYKRFLAMGGGHNVRIEWKKYYIKKEMERMVRAGDKKGLQKLWNELSEPYRLAADLYAETHNPLHLAAGALGVAGKAVGKAPEKIGEISEFIESIPRAQEFIRKAKDDPVGAMYAADEITTNFQKHGKARWVNSVFMFGNAGIQGIHKAFRHYTKGTKKELAMRWTKLILTGILLEALQAAFNRDDQGEYENLSTYTKNNNYVLSLGDGRFFKVPKPREFGVFSSAIGRSIEYVFGNDEAFYDFADYVFDTFSLPGIPSITDFDNSDGKAFEKVIHGVLSDTLFSGAFDIGFNIDYKGDEIVPSYMDNYKTESDKVYDTTSKFAIAIGKMLNMSPIKVDYLLSNGFGVFGRAAQYLLPNDSSRRDLTLGIKSRLIAQSQYSTDVYDLVYEKAEKAKKAYDAEEKKGYSAETLLEYEDTQMLKTLVSQYRRAIRYSNLTTKEKEQRLSELQALIRSWDSTPTEADKRSIELFESTGNADVFYKTFASNIESTLTGEVKVPQYEDGKIVAVKTMNYTAELSPDAYLMFFNDACKVVDEAKLALLNADELDDAVKAKKVAKNIKDGISKLKKRYLEDFGKPTEESK